MTQIILKTFSSLLVLEYARDAVKELLLDKYDEVVTPFIKIIQQVMAANNENHFEAAKRIQDKTNLVESFENKTMFAAALMEIVKDINLKF